MRYLFTKYLTIQATSETYSAADMCGPPANDTGFIDPGKLHTAIMEKCVILSVINDA